MFANSLVVRAHNAWYAFRNREDGQTLVEYSLIVALIALVCIGALTVLGGHVRDIFQKAGDSLADVPTTTAP